MTVSTVTLSGWGRYPTATVDYSRPERLNDLGLALQERQPLIARGCGRSYGDAALASGTVIGLERMDRLLAWDENTGVVRCEAGVTFADMIRVFLPRGWFLPVTPGTKFVTVGGSIACDIHGKNHHKAGALGSFVEELELVTAAGETVSCSPTRHPELFAATVGGMGLTGVILSATLRLRSVSSAFIRADCEKTRDLDATLERFATSDDKYEYSVGWIDCLARSRSLGRSVLFRGNHAAAGELRGEAREHPLRYLVPRRVTVPFDFPSWALSRGTLALFNSIYYAKQPGHAAGRITTFESFFYPLDRVQGWNRAYGRRGFAQYQCVLPFASARSALVNILERFSKGSKGSFLAVIKRFGDLPNRGLMSFPMPGLTLALDIPASRELPLFLDQVDTIVAEAGGKVYLAKDARLSRSAFERMYPQAAEWRRVKRAWDPNGRFLSLMAHRLGLGEGSER